jgi:hypothetical protein
MLRLPPLGQARVSLHACLLPRCYDTLWSDAGKPLDRVEGTAIQQTLLTPPNGVTSGLAFEADPVGGIILPASEDRDQKPPKRCPQISAHAKRIRPLRGATLATARSRPREGCLHPPPSPSELRPRHETLCSNQLHVRKRNTTASFSKHR